jgi:hypothetical protein
VNTTAIASELDKLQTGGLTPVPTPNVHISVQTVAAELVGTDEGSALASEQDAALVLNYSLAAVRLLDAADAEVPETVLKGVLDLASEVLAAAGEEGCQGFGELQDMVAQLAVVNQAHAPTPQATSTATTSNIGLYTATAVEGELAKDSDGGVVIPPDSGKIDVSYDYVVAKFSYNNHAKCLDRGEAVEAGTFIDKNTGDVLEVSTFTQIFLANTNTKQKIDWGDVNASKPGQEFSFDMPLQDMPLLAKYQSCGGLQKLLDSGAVSCRWYDAVDKTWKQDGCRYSGFDENVTPMIVKCSCTHMTGRHGTAFC